jgi:integrase
MSPEEEDCVLDAAAPHIRLIVIAALDTGMRRGELLHQRWEHVHLTRGLLYVSRSKTAGGEGREIPLTRRLYEMLCSIRTDEGPVFRYESRPITTFDRAWKSALRRAQVRHFRFHDLRHAFATRLMEAGVMPDVRMALMGHSTGHRVHARYTHVALPAKREAIVRLEKWVQQQRENGGIYGS